MRNLWSEWLKNDEKEFTKFGKIRSASYLIVSKKLKAAWEKVSMDLINRSFSKCGLHMERRICIVIFKKSMTSMIWTSQNFLLHNGTTM